MPVRPYEAIRDSDGFHFSCWPLRVLPDSCAQRLAHALTADPPSDPDRAPARHIIAALAFVRAIFGVTSPQGRESFQRGTANPVEEDHIQTTKNYHVTLNSRCLFRKIGSAGGKFGSEVSLSQCVQFWTDAA